ncbi:hypothetical protein D9757_014842 [Collybiopsis confluens]|uniref:Integrase catalytic domain-containing protein n=1 Tax=Collybiopsis confluens TaxID=2823264 RepID=A0A8H5CSJ6_9AGAR|nr:hypothetical protein D9757_014842 [Collybiopsis confluens]
MSSNPNSLPNLIVFAEDRQLLGITNWATFGDHLKSTARSTGLLGYLDGSIQPVPPIPVAGPVVPSFLPPTIPAVPTPINSRTPSIEEWELRDGRLAGIIYQNIKDPRAIGVTEDMSSNAMWVKLTGEYETTSAAAQALAKERIQQFKYNPGTRFKDYFKQLEALHSSPPLLPTISGSSRPTGSYSDLKRTLIEYDMMVESTNAVGLETVIPSALAVPGAIVCDNCNRNGHTKKGCWARGGGREGFAPRWYKAPKGMEPSGKTLTSSTVAATSSEDPPVTSAATTVYQFSDDDFNVLKVQDFVEMSERQTERKVKVFRIDMGREFDNKAMDAWCANRGILVEKIPKALSAANGQVERANGTIISGVRSMLEDSDLDNRFWAEGSASYCYIRGMIPTNRHPGKIPWEKWFEASGKKLGRQAWRGRLVGYMGRRGYRIWDPVRKGVYPVRDVICEEGIPRQTSGVVPVSNGPIFDDVVDIEAEQPGRAEVENDISTTEPSAEIKDNPGMIPNDPIPPRPLEPGAVPPVDIPTMRRSGRIRTASAQQLLHLESQDDENRARSAMAPMQILLGILKTTCPIRTTPTTTATKLAQAPMQIGLLIGPVSTTSDYPARMYPGFASQVLGNQDPIQSCVSEVILRLTLHVMLISVCIVKNQQHLHLDASRGTSQLNPEFTQTTSNMNYGSSWQDSNHDISQNWSQWNYETNNLFAPQLTLSSNDPQNQADRRGGT